MTDKPNVIEALSAVMADVQGIRKDQKNNAPNAGYMFRGIDAVMNAVGPALRTHGVVIVPESVQAHYRDVTTSGGKPSREATVTVSYRAYGPAGDSILMQSAGEAMDSGDKGTPKAMSVAYRTLLLQALTIPTDEPDPDSHTYERAAAPMTPAQQGKLYATLRERFPTKEAGYAWAATILSKPVEHGDFTSTEARRLIDALEAGETP